MSFAPEIVDKVVEAFRFVRAHSQHLPLAFESIFSLPCTVTTLQGTLRKGGDEVRVVYVGRRRNFAYLTRMLFDKYVESESLSANVFTYKEPMERRAAEADVIIVDLGWPYNGRLSRGGQYAVSPDWVSMFIKMPQSWEEVVSNFRQTTRNNDLRLIRRNGYVPRMTNDRRAIEHFYDQMYLPFVTHKHAEDSAIARRGHVLRRARKGHLLQVMRDDDVVAAGLVYPENAVLYFLWMGMPAEHIDSPPEGAISALYLFGLKYAFENKFLAVDFTGTRSFLNDGAFRFKRKWGAFVEDSFSPSSVLIRPGSGSLMGARFCERFPLLMRAEEGLEAVFVHVGEPVEEVLPRLKKEYGCAGLDRLTLIAISDRNETRSLPIDKDGCHCRIIRTTLDRFTHCYVTRSAEFQGSG